MIYNKIAYSLLYRICQNFQFEDKREISSQDAYDFYCAHCKDEQIIATDNSLFGKGLNVCFPEVIRFRKRIEKKQKHFYRHLTQTKSDTTLSFEDIPSVLDKSTSVQFIEETNSWQVVLITKENISGNELIKSVLFHDNFTFDINVGMYKVPTEKPLTYKLTKSSILGIMRFLQALTICVGFKTDRSEDKRSYYCDIVIPSTSKAICCRPCFNRRHHERYRVKKTPSSPDTTPSQDTTCTSDEVILEEADNMELRDILQRIHPLMADNDALKELLGCQQRNLNCAKKTSYRWPKR